MYPANTIEMHNIAMITMQRPPFDLPIEIMREIQKERFAVLEEGSVYDRWISNGFEGPGGTGKSATVMYSRFLPITRTQASECLLDGIPDVATFEKTEPLEMIAYPGTDHPTIIRAKRPLLEKPDRIGPYTRIPLNQTTFSYLAKRDLRSMGQLVRLEGIKESQKLPYLMVSRKNFDTLMRNSLIHTIFGESTIISTSDRTTLTTLVHQARWRDGILDRNSPEYLFIESYYNGLRGDITPYDRIFVLLPENLDQSANRVISRGNTHDCYDGDLQTIRRLGNNWLNLKLLDFKIPFAGRIHFVRSDLDSGLDKYNFPLFAYLTLTLYDYWKIPPLMTLDLSAQPGEVFITPMDHLFYSPKIEQFGEFYKSLHYIMVKTIYKYNNIVKEGELILPEELGFFDFKFGLTRINGRLFLLLWVANTIQNPLLIN